MKIQIKLNSLQIVLSVKSLPLERILLSSYKVQIKDLMLFEDLLGKYSKKGCFTFTIEEDFATKCNAPRDSAGVYLIYDLSDNLKELLYIGSSGQKDAEGNLKVRKGGLFDRLVNGYHPNRFGKTVRIKRRYAFPLHMEEQNVNKIGVYWWVTHDYKIKDFPTDIERKLESKFLSENGELPIWHQKTK